MLDPTVRVDASLSASMSAAVHSRSHRLGSAVLHCCGEMAFRNVEGGMPCVMFVIHNCTQQDVQGDAWPLSRVVDILGMIFMHISVGCAYYVCNRGVGVGGVVCGRMRVSGDTSQPSPHASAGTAHFEADPHLAPVACCACV